MLNIGKSLLLKTAIALALFYCEPTASAQTTPKRPALDKKIQEAIDEAAKRSGLDPGELSAAMYNTDENLKAPAKDAKRIAGLSSNILSYTALCTYIKQVHAAIEKKLEPCSLTEMNGFYELLKKEAASNNAVANAASNCMMLGNADLALWLMGKASIDQPMNANTLNNYAAFLIMNGGEHLAIPILKRLNLIYPKNTTILNNLGQAWFGLGDLDLAKRYLDTVQMILPSHSMAANTQSYIAERKGNKQQAILQAKQSIRSVYSLSKQRHIQKLGGKLTEEDINWSFSVPEDALGIDKFLSNRPPFYISRDEFLALQPQWTGFIEGCNDLSQRILGKAAEGIEEAMMQVPEPGVTKKELIIPAFWVHKAQAILDIITADHNEHAVRFLAKRQHYDTTILGLIERLQQDHEKILARYAGSERTYEIIKMEEQEVCKAKNAFVSSCYALNREMRDYYQEFLNTEKRFRKNSIYYKKFIAPTQQMYEKLQQTDLIAFLDMVGNLTPIAFDPAFQTIGDVNILGHDFTACTEPIIKEAVTNEFPEFGLMVCKSGSSFLLPKIGNISLQCNILITELDESFLSLFGSCNKNRPKAEYTEGVIGIGGEVGIVDAGVELDFTDKGFAEGRVGMVHDAAILKGVRGPLQVGAKGLAGVEVGFGPAGIEEFAVSGAENTARTDKELNINTGATTSMTWNAGGFSDSKRKLSAVNIAGFR